MPEERSGEGSIHALGDDFHVGFGWAAMAGLSRALRLQKLREPRRRTAIVLIVAPNSLLVPSQEFPARRRAQVAAFDIQQKVYLPGTEAIAAHGAA